MADRKNQTPEERKKELIAQTAQSFAQMTADNKSFILGYMLGVQQSKATAQPQSAQEVAEMEIQGTFSAQRFFETLAMIISQRENVKVTVTVKEREEKTKKSA